MLSQIVYVMGRGHSGSTVFDALLGNAVDTVGVGELVSGWNRTSSRCSCGVRVGECPFWSEVRRKYTCTTSQDWEYGGRLAAEQAHIRNFLRTAWTRTPDEKLVGTTADAFECIAATAGASTVVDSGKEFTRALFLLRSFPNTRVVFLVRRCDAVMASRLSRVMDGTGFKMLRRQSKSRALAPLFLTVTAINWCVGNLLGELIRRSYPDRVLRVRYEDLCSNTGSELERLSAFLNVDLRPVAQNVADGRRMPLGHKIAGNRMRDAGGFVFNPALSHSRPLPRPYRAIAWLFGAPLLRRYGYTRSVS